MYAITCKCTAMQIVSLLLAAKTQKLLALEQRFSFDFSANPVLYWALFKKPSSREVAQKKQVHPQTACTEPWPVSFPSQPDTLFFGDILETKAKQSGQ